MYDTHAHIFHVLLQKYCRKKVLDYVYGLMLGVKICITFRIPLPNDSNLYLVEG